MKKRRKIIMNKVEFVALVSEKLTTDERKETKKFASEVVDCVIETIKEQIAEGNEVNLSGFGKFSVVDKPQAEKRNPATGSTVTVPAHKSPKFKYSSTVKNMLKAV